MNFIDTHTHLYVEQFNEDREAVINTAIEAGITKFLLPNIDLKSVDGMHELVGKFPQNCFPMMGLHPCSVGKDWENVLFQLKKNFETHAYCAIGEIGLDLYWDKSTLPFQQAAFKAQVGWAKEKKLPIAIHVRDAFDELFELMDELNDASLTGVFHCFTGNQTQAEKALSYGGFMLGIGGVLTFKNSGLDKVIETVDLDQLILETDSPYLAPHPKRGKRNESSYLTFVASKLAEIKNVSIEELAIISSQNALRLFNTVK